MEHDSSAFWKSEVVLCASSGGANESQIVVKT